MGLLEHSIIVGTVVGIIIIGLLATTVNTEYFDNTLSWVLLTISIGASIIIALIVYEQAKQSHREVTTSQTEITNLIRKLDETDKKHNMILDILKESNAANEELATNTLISTLEYIVDMLGKLFNHIKPDDLHTDDRKLIKTLLTHLESPLNLILQVLPHTGNRLKEQKKELSDNVLILRKIIIASIVTGDAETKRTAKVLFKNKIELKDVLEKIKNHM